MSRNRFTGADLDFLAAMLAPGEQRLHLEKLWGDADARREMLDLKEVFRGLLDAPSAVQVSPRFYFYVLVRQAFLRADLCDPDLANYVAGLMTKRISRRPMIRCRTSSGVSPTLPTLLRSFRVPTGA